MSVSAGGKSRASVGKRESCGRNVLNPLLSEVRLGSQVCSYMQGTWSVFEAWRTRDNTVRARSLPSLAPM